MSTENTTAATPLVQHLSASPSFNNAHIYTPAVQYENLLFLAGKTSWAASEPEDIRIATKFVLDGIEKELKHAGSSMEKVLKAVVYLRSMDDYDAMNEIYVGRFGAKPPARTTLQSGLPRNSIVGIDVTAYI
jgi:enamine deaminase RidA (YjgF/YER057c/UK114 family)